MAIANNPKETQTLTERLMEKSVKTMEKQVGDVTAQKLQQGENPENILKQLVDTVESKETNPTKPQTDNKEVLRSLLMALGGGLAAAGGNKEFAGQLLSFISKQQEEQQKSKITPQTQMDTLLETQKLLDQQGLNTADINITATGVPTISIKSDVGLSELSSDQQVAAYDLARRIGGVRGAQKALPGIIKSFKEGKTADMIEDDLRYMQQSPEFSNSIRDAAQQLMVGEGKDVTNRTFDYLDDLVVKGDKEGVKSYLKRMSVVNAPVDQRNLIMGKERTIEFLDEIKTDLATLQSKGIDTGFVKGNYENLIARAGQVESPEMRKVATKIAVAIMQFRRSMTGVQFGMLENREYKVIFPNINKVEKFNLSTLEALDEAFKGDLERFYSLSIREYDEDGSPLWWLNPAERGKYHAGWYHTEDLKKWAENKGPVIGGEY